jgi:glycosyltransferase involved in cell wall biosynthesis
MPAATVLIPTFDHRATLPQAVASVLAQTFEDFELFIVADGVADDMRATIAGLAASDGRNRVFEFPKGERKGERHRHAALQEASGRIVAYLGDDDLWMPNHLKAIALLLDGADFGNTQHIGAGEEGRFSWYRSDLGDPVFRSRMLADPPFNAFDMTFAGHTLAAYRRLAIGWAPPVDCPWADLYLWRQFLADPTCRARSAPFPTAVCTQTHRRPNLTDSERGAELAAVAATMADPEEWRALWQRLSGGNLAVARSGAGGGGQTRL